MSEVERRLDAIGVVLNSLGTELGISLLDPRVPAAMLAAIALGVACLLIGTWFARRVGLLSHGAPHGETLGVGLGLGLLVVAAWWAVISSGGRSAFTPVGVAFALALVAVARTRQGSAIDRPPPLASVVPVVVAAVAFVVAVGLLYGITLAPSPREGAQPIEFFDVAYYSVLGADLARTGTESIYSPSGFEQLPGLSPQTWYHWGEIWLSALMIGALDIDPIFARHYVVLPVVLLSAAALTGTLVRRLSGTSSRGAFLLGACGCLLLAPIALPIPGPWFTKWASGLVFGITLYGLGAVAALLSMYILVIRGGRGGSWSLSLVSGAAIASMVPTHILVAILALIGAAGAGALYVAQGLLTTRRLPPLPAVRRRTLVVTAVIGLLTIGWGVVTGHQLGASALSAGIAPFTGAWVQSVLRTVLGAGALLAIPAAWFAFRRDLPLLAWLSIGTTIILVVGAVAWGARVGDYNMFHVYFGAIVVFGTPIAAAAVVALWRAARATGRHLPAAFLFVICGVQLGIGGITAIGRLQGFGPLDYQHIPLDVLDAASRLPTTAKLAYACRSLEEPAFWDPSLVSISAHTGRPVVPMCFQAEAFTWLITGYDSSEDVMNPLFRFAPQRELYPNSTAQPTEQEIERFMETHAIGYVYADADHPNVLLPDATLIASKGAARLFQLP